jgi:hypothetical protein
MDEQASVNPSSRLRIRPQARVPRREWVLVRACRLGSSVNGFDMQRDVPAAQRGVIGESGGHRP